MTVFMTPVFGKPWASVVPAAPRATTPRAGDHATGLPVLGDERLRSLAVGVVLGEGDYAGGGRGSGALIPNQPVQGSLPVRRQVLTS